jgi:metal-responsive CopG/Arc/MetJ family transcriptional regulator
MTSYTHQMKTAISVPDDDFERFERVAAKHGMNRSEFYRRAAQKLADELEGASELTAIANAVLARAGDPTDDLFLRAAARTQVEHTEW